MTEPTRAWRTTFFRCIGLGIVVMVAVGLAACGGTSNGESGGAPAKADVLTVADSGIVTTLDPRASSSSEVRVLANLYETLILANPPGSPEPYSPCLATSWEKSSDGLVWTFHLREGVTFHDGTPFNAAAVKYSFDATTKLGLGFAYIWSDLEKVRVVDDYTVELTMAKSLPVEPLAAAQYGSWIFSPKSAGKPQEWWDEGRDAGTGPYVLESYKPNQEIVLGRNTEYWGKWKDNQFQTVVLPTITEPQTARQMLENGTVDGVQIVPADSVPALKANPNLQVQELATLTSVIIYLNTQRAPLDNVLVRQALAYATPYQDIITASMNDLAVQSNGPMPEGLWPRDDTIQPYTYDINKAKDLMVQAGYPDANFKVVMSYPAEESYHKNMAVLLKESWAKIGFQLDIRPMLWAQAWEKAKGPEDKRWDVLSITWWPGYAHGYDTLYEELHSETTTAFNLAYWSDKEYDNLIDTAWATESLDRPKAKAMYDEAQVMIHDQVPIIYAWDFLNVVAWSNKLKFEPMAECMFYPVVIRYYYVTL